ncbi:(2Fe-2S)-binding protein [Agrobacterium rhizogenes]|jgi:isoquinoline 1-oxidoreductase alpha subunit|nr:(2Fe-2S)-binding protein [Rhizobium rhizogenes]NTJ80979.1 (2Fe-2S)-binding protein [Rhizobium rhizogenes]
MKFTINGRDVDIDAPPDEPLLWVIRELVGLTGTKFGCGIGACGACTVHVDGESVRSCTYPAALLEGKRITTIEGLSPDRSHPVQVAWVKHQVPQCGYCQSGMVMSAAALLLKVPHPSDEDINQGITNICRCGTYSRVRPAIHTAADLAARGKP